MCVAVVFFSSHFFNFDSKSLLNKNSSVNKNVCFNQSAEKKREIIIEEYALIEAANHNKQQWYTSSWIIKLLIKTAFKMHWMVNQMNASL